MIAFIWKIAKQSNMANKRIRIGVAGLGRIGWEYHCPEVAKHDEYRFVAVQDVLAGRVREAEQSYGVCGYTDFADMLRKAELEAVTIATPSHLHREMTEQALAAGCHVVVEKPMATNAKDAGSMVRAARRSRRLLTVYQPTRASAQFQHLRQLLASGVIGEVYHVRVAHCDFVRRNDWQSLRRFGGGMLANYGAHALDQLLQLIGYDIRRVFCNLRAVATLGDAEDVVKIVLETRKGVIGEVDINQASPIRPSTLQVWGTLGGILNSPDRQGFHLRRFSAADLKPRQLDPSLASRGRRYPDDEVPFTEETIPVDHSLRVDFYRDFAAAVRRGRPLLVKPEEAAALMRIMDRCREDSHRIVRTRLQAGGLEI